MIKGSVIIKNLSKKFKIGFIKKQSILGRICTFLSGREPQKIIWVLKNLSFSAYPGEVLGIIGDNGSGKSTLLRIIAGIYTPDSGTVETKGKIISLINLQLGLKGRLTMKENIYLLGCLFGVSQSEIKKKFHKIVNFSGLEEFLETKIYQFSQGMRYRLFFSVAIHCNPDILLFDEILEVGDENFKKKCEKKIKELAESGVLIIFVSHDLNLINKYCTRIIKIESGKIISENYK